MIFPLLSQVLSFEIMVAEYTSELSELACGFEVRAELLNGAETIFHDALAIWTRKLQIRAIFHMIYKFSIAVVFVRE